MLFCIAALFLIYIMLKFEPTVLLGLSTAGCLLLAHDYFRIRVGQPEKAYVIKNQNIEPPTTPRAAAAQNNERIPCPSCAEMIMPAASVCHFCKTPIMSRNKSTNAILNLAWFVVLFFGAFFALDAFIWEKAESDTARIMQKAEADTERLMRSLGQP